MFISSVDSRALKNIQQAVHSNASLANLFNVCERMQNQIQDGEFAFLYGALLTAKAGRISDALALLDRVPSKPFGIAIREFLLDTNAFEPAGIVFKDPRPYDVWNQAAFYHADLKYTLDAVANFAGEPFRRCYSSYS